MQDAAVLIGVCDLQDKIKVSDKNSEFNKNLGKLPKEINFGSEYSAMLQEGEVFCQIEPFSFANASK